MAISVASSGSQTATISTEHSLYSTTVAGVYVLRVDLTNLTNTDILILRIKKKVRTGDTVRLLYKSPDITTAQGEPNWQSIAVVCPFGADFTLQQTAGTGRAFPWSVDLLGAPTVASSGSQTATLNTDHTLYTASAAGIYLLTVDTAALVNGERLYLTCRSKIRTGDSLTIVTKRHVRHAQHYPIKQGIPIVCQFSADFILRQEGGTSRAFPWSVEQIG